MNYKVEFQTRSELSHWELSHMINVLGNTYMKLTMLNEMQKLYNNGAKDKDFIIGSKSLDLRTNIMELNILIQLPREFEYTILDRKSNNADLFWETFNNLQRPIIMYKTSNGYKSLYNYENHLIFQEISTNSPQWLKTLGKSASIGLATLVFENVAEHYIDEFLFEDKDKIVIEQNEKIIKQNDKLVIDTKYFSEDFKERITSLLDSPDYKNKFKFISDPHQCLIGILYLTTSDIDIAHHHLGKLTFEQLLELFTILADVSLDAPVELGELNANSQAQDRTKRARPTNMKVEVYPTTTSAEEGE